MMVQGGAPGEWGEIRIPGNQGGILFNIIYIMRLSGASGRALDSPGGRGFGQNPDMADNNYFEAGVGSAGHSCDAMVNGV